MDKSVINRSSCRPPDLVAAFQLGGASKAAAAKVTASEEVAFAEARESRSSTMDIVVFSGPGQGRHDLEAITKAAINAGLKIKVIEVADSSFLTSTLKADLYLGGELGPDTQLVARFAVASGVAGSNQHVLLSEDGTETMLASDFISWVRTPPPGMPCGPRPASWSGTVHVVCERSRTLLDAIKPQTQSWMSGTVLAYGGRKRGSGHNTLTAMLDLCNYLGSVKDEPAFRAPEYIAARMLGVVGDTLACFGGKFEKAVVVGAPRTPDQGRHDLLLACLEDGEGRQPRIAGAPGDLRTLAGAMRHPRVRGHAARRQTTKIENAYVVRAERRKLGAMDALLRKHPELKNFHDRFGSSARDIYNRVASTVELTRAMDLLSAGNGGIESLRCILDNVDKLCRLGMPFRINLANMLHGQPELLAEAVRWTARHDHESLFLHLWPAVAQADRSSLEAQCLVLAMEHGAQLAIGLLGMYHPQKTIPELIFLGMRNGASREVVFAWLSKLDWMTGHDAAQLVLEGLCEAQLFPRLPALLAERSPAVFDALLAVMRQDKDRYSSYAEALLDHAQEHGNASLYRLLVQGYFLAGRRVDAQPADPEADAVHVVEADG